MMDAGEVVSDRQLLSDFIRRTRAVYESLGETLAWLERQEAESEPPFYEYEADARFVQVDDEVLSGDVWRLVVASGGCVGNGWHLNFSDGSVSCSDSDFRFRVRRPRGERAA